jgi:hypothetical protein
LVSVSILPTFARRIFKEIWQKALVLSVDCDCRPLCPPCSPYLSPISVYLWKPYCVCQPLLVHRDTRPVQSSGPPLIEPTRLLGHQKGCTATTRAVGGAFKRQKYYFGATNAHEFIVLWIKISRDQNLILYNYIICIILVGIANNKLNWVHNGHRYIV